MKVIVFDPADEERMQEWMTRGSRKEIVHQTQYFTSVGGTVRHVVVVLYVEERHPDHSGASGVHAVLQQLADRHP